MDNIVVEGINERLRFLRNHLNLTTRKFAKHINMSCGAITNMEKAQRNITERTIKDICREFNVNEEWLRNGKGEMYTDLVQDLNIDADVKNLVEKYAQLNQADKLLVKNLMESLAEKK